MVYIAIFVFAIGAAALCLGRVPRSTVIITGLAVAWATAEMQDQSAAALALVGLIVSVVAGQTFLPLVLDIVGTFRRIVFPRLVAIAARSLILSLPALFLALASIIISLKIGDWLTQKTVYSIPIDLPWACKTDRYQQLVCPETRVGPRDDIDLAIVRVFDVLGDELKGAARASIGAGQDSAEAAIVRISNDMFGADPRIPRSLPDWSPAFRYRIDSCKWYHWLIDTVECIRRIFLMPLDVGYRQVRSDLEADFKLQMEAAIVMGRGGAGYLSSSVDNFVDFRLEDARERVRAGNQRVFWYLDIWSALSILMVVLIYLKILFVIYARFVYDIRFGALPIEFSEDKSGRSSRIRICDITSGVGAVRGAHGSGFSQSLSKRSWYANFSGSLRPNRKGKFGIPRPFSLLVSRIIAQKIFFSKYTNKDNGTTFGGHGSHDLRFMRISIPCGKRVVVRLENLVAFSSEIKMYSVFEPRLALLLRHSFFLRVFEGPGHILLSAMGGSASIMVPGGAAADPNDIIAFDLDGGFNLDVDHGFLSVYIDDYSLMPAGQTVALRTTVLESKRSARPLIRKLIFFMFPF